MKTKQKFFVGRREIRAVASVIITAVLAVGLFLGAAPSVHAGGGGPSVNTISPATDYTIISGSFGFEASVVDVNTQLPLTPDSVDFVVNGTTILPATFDSGSGTWKATFDSTSLPDGFYAFYAREFTGGVEVQGAAFTIAISNNGGGESATMVTPVNGSTISSSSISLDGIASTDVSSFDFIVQPGNQVKTDVSGLGPDRGGDWFTSYDASSLGDIDITVTPFARLLNGGLITGAPVTIHYTATPTGIAITSPTENQIVSGSTFSLDSHVSGGTDASAVDFIISGAGNLTLPASESKCQTTCTDWSVDLDSTSLPAGSYSIIASSTISGVNVNSPSVDFSIAQPTGVVITQPSSSDVLSGTAGLSATSVDTADSLDFLVTPAGGGSTQTISATFVVGRHSSFWTTSIDTTQLVNGSYTIVARGTFGLSTVDSLPVTVSVSNGQQGNFRGVAGVTLDSPLDGSNVSGTVIFLATATNTDSNVDFVLTNPQTFVQQTFPGIFASSTGQGNHWTLSWNSASAPNQTYQVFARIASVRPGIFIPSNTVTITTTNIFSSPESTSVSTVNFVSPLNNASVSGIVALQMTVSPSAASAGFDIYKDNAGLATHLNATQQNGIWTAEWDTSTLTNGTYDIEPGALNGQGIPSLGEVHVVTVQNQGTTATTSTSPITPPVNLDVDVTATGTYSAETAMASNPSIDVDLGISTSTAPALCTAGGLIKIATNSAVYYCGQDGKRYVFPNATIFSSWFSDFSSVVTISADTMAQIPMGGNIGYRPGSRMIKITTDPKVYAVSRGNLLRWVTTEAVAKRLYGLNWNTKIDDVSVAFFAEYQIGAPIE